MADVYVYACMYASAQLLSGLLPYRAAERHEYARRSRASEEVMRDRMTEAKSLVDEEKLSKRELSFGQRRIQTSYR